MSCKYNNCNHCGFKSECEIYKENAELEAQIEQEKNLSQCRLDHNEQLREMIEKMKNCRNCKNYMIEGACGHFTQVGWCRDWELAE